VVKAIASQKMNCSLVPLGSVPNQEAAEDDD